MIHPLSRTVVVHHNVEGGTRGEKAGGDGLAKHGGASRGSELTPVRVRRLLQLVAVGGAGWRKCENESERGGGKATTRAAEGARQGENARTGHDGDAVASRLQLLGKVEAQRSCRKEGVPPDQKALYLSAHQSLNAPCAPAGVFTINTFLPAATAACATREALRARAGRTVSVAASRPPSADLEDRRQVARLKLDALRDGQGAAATETGVTRLAVELVPPRVRHTACEVVEAIMMTGRSVPTQCTETDEANG